MNPDGASSASSSHRDDPELRIEPGDIKDTDSSAAPLRGSSSLDAALQPLAPMSGASPGLHDDRSADISPASGGPLDAWWMNKGSEHASVLSMPQGQTGDIEEPRDIAPPLPSGAGGPSIESSSEPRLPVGDETPAPAVEAEPQRATNQEILDRSRSLWQDHEPDDPSDPVAHTDHLLLQADNWLVFGASRRGRSHAHDAKYREDSFSVKAIDGWILVAVADGTGSQPLARVGARLASHAAMSHMATALGGTRGTSDAEIPALLRSAISGAFAAALVPLVEEAARRNRAVNDLSTTLVLLACQSDSATPWVATGQVGDGGVAVRMQNGSCAVLGKADHGDYGGETLFLTSHESQLTWQKRANAYRVSEPINALMVASDGVMDDFVPPFGQLPPLFDEVGPMAADSAPDESLLEWLTYERRSSFDDRTLVAILQIATENQ